MEHSSTACVDEFMAGTGLDINETAELYTLFLQELECELGELKKSCHKQDFVHMQKIVHNIKGISSNYLAVEVYEIAKVIDEQLKTGIKENLEIKISNLLHESDILKDIITSFFNDRGIILEV